MTNFRNRHGEWRWAERRSGPEDPDDDRIDLHEECDDHVPEQVAQICNHLEETLTDDMALRAYHCRNRSKPRDGDEFENFKKELIAEAFNAGYDEWSDDFLELD